MAFPPEFKFQNEADFIDKLIVPLLQRLGFSLVVHYHGNREFGKDLVFGEIDRFGHVRYFGLQAKYEESISVNAVEGLINDAKQAFRNPFRHPNTGADERISMFYAVNGGSFPDQARDHFFNSLIAEFGSNVSLLDGKSLIVLDRGIAASSGKSVEAMLEGLRAEIRFNREMVRIVCAELEKWKEGKPAPLIAVYRFRNSAALRYLEQPILPSIITMRAAHCCWYETELANALLHQIGVPFQMMESRKGWAIGAKAGIDKLLPAFDALDAETETARKSLGPLIAI